MDLIKKYNLNKSTWTYKGFHGVPHTFFPIIQLRPLVRKIFGAVTHINLFFAHDDYIDWYWSDDDLENLRTLFFKRLKGDSDYLEKLKKNWHKALKGFDLTIAKVDTIDLSRLSNSGLCSLYQEFYQSYLGQFAYFMALGDAISMQADQYLVPEFKKVLGRDFTRIFPQLMMPSHQSFIEEEQAARRKLIPALKNRGKVATKLLTEHAAKYFYIQNNYAKAKYLTAEDFAIMIKKDPRLKIKTSSLEKISSVKKGLIKKYNFSAWHKQLMYVVDEFFSIQDTRKKYVLIANYYQFEFLRIAEQRTRIPFNLLTYSIYPEFKDILAKKIDLQALRNRKKLSLFVSDDHGYKIFTGSTVQNGLSFFKNSGDKISGITGMVASRGKVKGRVKVILKIHDMVNMNVGDILVTTMTRPEMLPAMHKASAIVADEGGITSHAAIISRELGIPCVIGTKVATRVLKDGDLVEVDANTGVVRKLDK